MLLLQAARSLRNYAREYAGQDDDRLIPRQHPPAGVHTAWRAYGLRDQRLIVVWPARALVILVLVLTTGCEIIGVDLDDDEQEPEAEVTITPTTIGDPNAGADLIIGYGCVACHTIPGIASASGTVGPPLTDFAERDYIAGTLINNPDNLIHWIMNPQDVEPGTAMPNMGVSEDDARDIAAYLYTLR